MIEGVYLKELPRGNFGPYSDFYFSDMGVLTIDIVSPIYSLMSLVLPLVVPGLIGVVQPNPVVPLLLVSVLGWLVVLLFISISYLLAYRRRLGLSNHLISDALALHSARLIPWSSVNSLSVKLRNQIYLQCGKELYVMRVKSADVGRIRTLYLRMREAPDSHLSSQRSSDSAQVEHAAKEHGRLDPNQVGRV